MFKLCNIVIITITKSRKGKGVHMKKYLVFILFATVLATVNVDAATFTVTNTNTSGAGSLAQAILDANSAAGADNIHFNIPGPGPHTISVSTLPNITGETVIDGTTQPGSSTGAWPPTLQVEIQGTGSGFVTGLYVQSNNSTIRGLIISGFVQGNIWLQGINSKVEYCLIGTDVTGTAASSKVGRGIIVKGRNHTIGGSSESKRNLISGNFIGIWIEAGDNNTVKGNYIGTDVYGTSAIPNNTSGIDIDNGADNNQIGGTSPGDGNLISGNKQNGMMIKYNSKSNTVQGNLIGTDVTGLKALGNDWNGIDIEGGDDNLIGGTVAGARNIISGNGSDGIEIDRHVRDNQATGNKIFGNFIGAGIDGSTNVGNKARGVNIFIGGNSNQIGGTSSGQPNLIIHNKFTGVAVAQGVWNRIWSNSIYSTGQAIDVAACASSGSCYGATSNDYKDPDTGGNFLQNYPSLTLVETGPSGTRVVGNLNSVPLKEYYIEFFHNPVSKREARYFLGSVKVTTDGNGDAPIDVTFSAVLTTGDYVTSTATDPDFNTSEISNVVRATVIAGNVAGTVWNDASNDGVIDAGESGLQGVTVKLFESDGVTLVASTTTASNGSYSFSNIVPGAYIVDVDDATLPSGLLSTTNNDPESVSVIANQTAEVNFGYLKSASVNGTVWDDVNDDGVIDAGENGLEGVTVNLYENDGVTLVASTTTASNGHYSFDGLAPGDYIVDVDDATLPSGLLSTTKNDPESVALVAEQTAEANFGYVEPVTISGVVWYDANDDGVVDADETRLGSVTVNLYADDGATLLASGVTLADGSYEFTGLRPGDYVVMVDESTLPVNYLITTDNNPEEESLGAGEEGNAIFGYRPCEPKADFTADVTEGIGEVCVQFTNLSTEASKYFWDFGDGNTSTEENPKHCFTNPPLKHYTVTLTAYCPPDSEDTVTKANFIVVRRPTDAAFNASPIALTPGETVSFVNNSGGLANRFLWDYGDGNTQMFQGEVRYVVDPAHAYEDAGEYSVSLKAWGQGGEDIMQIENLIYVDPFFVDLSLVDAGATVDNEGWDNAIDHDVISTNANTTAMADDAWAVFEFADAGVKKIHKIRMMTNNAFGSKYTNHLVKNVELWASADSVDYALAFSGSIDEKAGWQIFEFDPVSAKYIKLVLVDARGENSPYISLGEFQVFAKPETKRMRFASLFNDESNIDGLPTDFMIYQNYPNPFNPDTRIWFQVPELSHVELKVYNIRGELITELLNDQRETGYHEIAWNGRDLYGSQISSGVYFMTIRASGIESGHEYRLTKKMTFMK